MCIFGMDVVAFMAVLCLQYVYRHFVHYIGVVIMRFLVF